MFWSQNSRTAVTVIEPVPNVWAVVTAVYVKLVPLPVPLEACAEPTKKLFIPVTGELYLNEVTYPPMVLL